MDEKLRMLEEIMELDEGALELDTQLDEVEEWDSISKLALMAEAKKNWGKTITVDEIKAFVTVQDICDYLG